MKLDVNGAAQDVEWSLVDEGEGERRLVILQSRPITALPVARERCGERRVWDNSNIIESYCGVTTPLTFSFASRAYFEVYSQLMRMMGFSLPGIMRALRTTVSFFSSFRCL